MSGSDPSNIYNILAAARQGAITYGNQRPVQDSLGSYVQPEVRARGFSDAVRGPGPVALSDPDMTMRQLILQPQDQWGGDKRTIYIPGLKKTRARE